MLIKKTIRKFLPNSLVNLVFHFPNALVANIYYGFPSRKLKVIGVTGSDGKTTTSTLIYQILTDSGRKTALISSVAAKIGKEQCSTGFHVTTPDPWLLQKLIKKISSEGFEFLVLESTSHGFVQYRLFGVNFLVGVITNITHEHLDYHKTFKNYQMAKSKLFTGVKFAILNKDDASFEFLLSKINPKAKKISYSLKEKADFTLSNFHFNTLLPGNFNKYNCLAAIAVCTVLNISKENILKSIAEFSGVEGRMQEICEGQLFRVVVDFAHTPNALENALLTLKSQLVNDGKLISVFGCAGLRDIKKRPMMGNISARIADISIFTAEDPRTENLDDIINQMIDGAQSTGAEKYNKNSKKNTFLAINDRAEAIEYAISIAHKNDIVGIFGKGHEQSMCFGNIEQPWDDRAKARKILKKYLKNE